MGIKEENKKKILNLMLQDVPTEEIARQLNYSVGTIRMVFEELREEYGASTKTGLAVSYLKNEVSKVATQLNNILELVDNSCQITTNAKRMPRLDKRQNKKTKRKK